MKPRARRERALLRLRREIRALRPPTPETAAVLVLLFGDTPGRLPTEEKMVDRIEQELMRRIFPEHFPAQGDGPGGVTPGPSVNSRP